MIDGFLWVLKDYDMRLILKALGEYAKRNSDIPAPADIANIIDPPPPKLSAAEYVNLMKRIREGYYPLSDERAFIGAFREQEYAKVRGGSPLLLEADEEIERHGRARAIGFDGGEE